MSILFPGHHNSFDRNWDTIISTFFGPVRPQSRFNSVSNTPKANVMKEDNAYVIELAAPGFSREEFEIGVDNGILSIQVGTSDTPEYSEKLTSQEYSYASFKRSWTLPKNVNAEMISARYDAGILYVTVPTNDNTNNKLVIDVE